MADVTKFQARKATIAYSTTPITWDVATKASDETFTGNATGVKNFTFTTPSFEAEEVLCLGSTAQTIGANHRTTGTATGAVAATFQNAAQNLKVTGGWKMTGTLVLTGDEQFIDILGLGSATAITGGNSRYPVGNLSSNNWAANLTGALRAFWNNGSEEFCGVICNPIVKLGDRKATGADGYFEVDFEATGLAKDGILEWKD